MLIRNKLNGGVAEVDDALGKRLIDADGWSAVTVKSKPAPKPAEAPTEE